MLTFRLVLTFLRMGDGGQHGYLIKVATVRSRHARQVGTMQVRVDECGRRRFRGRPLSVSRVFLASAPHRHSLRSVLLPLMRPINHSLNIIM